MNKLESFKEKLTKIYVESKLVDEIMSSHKLQRPKFFWFNKGFKGIEVLKLQGFELKEIFLKELFYSENNSELISQTKEFDEGKFYIQNPSSYFTAHILNVDPKDRVLDMCASPGSKTLSIVNSIDTELNITAVEKNTPRFFKMKENFRKLGYDYIRTINLDANFYLKKFASDYESFDKVLLDAPCSTESHINLNDAEPLKTWRPNAGKSFSKIQKGLINTAFKLLKSGGEMVYSTCTYSQEENEKVVKWILKRFPELELMEIKFPNEMRIFEIEERMYRVIPDEKCEAFFICKLKKN